MRVLELRVPRPPPPPARSDPSANPGDPGRAHPTFTPLGRRASLRGLAPTPLPPVNQSLSLPPWCSGSWGGGAGTHVCAPLRSEERGLWAPGARAGERPGGGSPPIPPCSPSPPSGSAGVLGGCSPGPEGVPNLPLNGGAVAKWEGMQGEGGGVGKERSEVRKDYGWPSDPSHPQGPGRESLKQRVQASI